eukprot:11560643-Heterocapsa_arctica.AAC.1
MGSPLPRASRESGEQVSMNLSGTSRGILNRPPTLDTWEGVSSMLTGTLSTRTGLRNLAAT